MKKSIRLSLIGLISFLASMFGEKNRIRIRQLVSSALNLGNISDETVSFANGKKAIFHCPNDLTRWRVETIFEKEPETLEWIDGFEKDDVLWDIGANMGLYTIYAATHGTRVLAFEPSAANFYVLNLSIFKSNLSNIATAYCLAFNDIESTSELMMQNFDFGGALSSFGTTIGYDGKKFTPKIKQGMIGYSIDGYISSFNPLFPNHIKIDVDGIEDKIISGGRNTLLDSRLRSISIELDAERPEYTNAVVEQIVDKGFKLQSKRHAAMFDNTLFARNFNYQFNRI